MARRLRLRTGPGRQVEVCVVAADGRVRISVSNSGNPIAADLDPRQEATMGLRLVEDLVARYGGSFTLRPYGEGSVAEIDVSQVQLLAKE